MSGAQRWRELKEGLIQAAEDFRTQMVDIAESIGFTEEEPMDQDTKTFRITQDLDFVDPQNCFMDVRADTVEIDKNAVLLVFRRSELVAAFKSWEDVRDLDVVPPLSYEHDGDDVEVKPNG